MKKLGNGNKFGSIVIKRGLAAILAGCLLTTTLAACGGDDKKEESSSASTIPNTLSSTTTPQVLASPTPAATAKAVRVKVDDSLNVRDAGSKDGEILGTVENGTELALLAETAQNGWYQVQYKGRTAYVSAEFVDVIDITIEKYNALKGSSTSEPGGESSEAPAGTSSEAPEGSEAPGGAASQTPTDNEDGE